MPTDSFVVANTLRVPPFTTLTDRFIETVAAVLAHAFRVPPASVQTDRLVPADRVTPTVRDWTSAIWSSLDQPYYGNTLQVWLTAGVVLIVVLLVLRIAKAIVARRASRIAEKRGSEWIGSVSEATRATKLIFLFVLSLFIASLMLQLPSKVTGIVRSVTIITLLLQAAIWGSVLLTFGIAHYIKKRGEDDAAAVTTISALAFVGRLVLWSVVGLLVLDNVGVDVTALIAGLGVGGIAVALAAQNILGDLFASLSIVVDKPFVLGDFIVVGDYFGTVERIGMKTTRIRSLSGEQLVFSNNDLLEARIRNLQRMQQRRVVFHLGVTYETPHAKLSAIPATIGEIIESQEDVRFDRAHFKQYGDFALIFEVVYYVLTADYTAYMDRQQTINLAIFERFEREGIEFAYPTQTLYVHKLSSSQVSDPQRGDSSP